MITSLTARPRIAGADTNAVPAGPPGIQGDRGPAGATWRVGPTAPADSLGVDGDVYLRSGTADVYQRAAGAYAIVANLRGIQGIQGVVGATWLTGSGVPAAGLGRDGDWYLQASTGDLFTKAAGSWGTPVLNITVAGGVVRYDAAQSLTSPQKAQAIANLGLAPFLADGCCRLAVQGSNTIKLYPFNGSSLIVNGLQRTLPAAGLAAANTGLAVSTAFYVYVADDMSLVLSTTGYSFDPLGRANMMGDATKRLVGMVATNASGGFDDSAINRLCLNWFNRRRLVAQSAVTGQSITSTFASVGNRLSFLTWGEETVSIRMSGYTSVTLAGAAMGSAIYLDGNAAGSECFVHQAIAAGYSPLSCEFAGSLPDGLHATGPYGLVTSGTGSWSGLYVVETRG